MDDDIDFVLVYSAEEKEEKTKEEEGNPRYQGA